MKTLFSLAPAGYGAIAAAAGTGFAAALGQVILLRELLALFSGFELAAGLFLASWLLWTALGSRLASGLGERLSPGPLLLLLAPILPGTLLLLRASRPLWGIPLGELPGLGLLLALCALAPALFCLVSGALFAVCWTRAARSGRSLQIYLAEAVGSGLAGLTLFFLLLPFFSTLESVLLTAVALLCAGLSLSLWRWSSASGPRILLCLSPLALLPLLFSMAPQLETVSRRWQWGPGFIAGQDTPYQNLAVCRQAAQFSFFSDGGWLFSQPDQLSAEFAVEPVLLLHPSPKSVLLLGGNPLALPVQFRNHQQVQDITLVEQDPGLLELLQRILPEKQPSERINARRSVLLADPGVVIRSPGKRFDIILLQLGEPVNAARNRFYTRNFFQAVDKRLAPGGLFSFTAPGAPEAVGPVQARLLRSLNATLKAVFPLVLALPGPQIRFIASNDTQYAGIMPGTLLQRMQKRKHSARFFRKQNVMEMFGPFKRGYLRTLLAQAPQQVVLNQDFRPACYLDSLLAWTRQMDDRLFALFQKLSYTDASILWGGVSVAGLLLAFFPLAFRSGALACATATAVCVTGGCLMSFQLLLLLVFQILAGSLFSRLALLIAASMAGLALGALLSPRKGSPLPRLLLTQALLCLLLAGFSPFFSLLHARIPPLSGGALLGICLVLALAGGMLGGAHFGLSVRLLAATGKQLKTLGGRLYALDLCGAALGSACVSLVLLPLYGLRPVMFACALLCFGSLCGLFLASRSK